MGFTIPSSDDRRMAVELFDDFIHLHDWWTAVNDGGSGTNTLDDTAGGTYSIKTAGADNDYHYLHTDSEFLLPAAGKPLRVSARLKLTEATTDDATFGVGVSNTVDNTLLTTGGITQANKGIAIVKKEDGTSWIGEWSDGTTKRTQTLGSFTSGSFAEVGFLLKTSSANDTYADLVFFVDDTEYEAQRVLISGLATEMHGWLGVVAGVGNGAETLVVDWVHFHQAR